MSRLDDLLPDQRAALSLLLRQRKTYAEVAALLSIPERAVRDRAHAALAVLAPRQARELSPEQREEIGDYLLGQRGGVAERLQTRTFLMGSGAGRAWGEAISVEIAPLAAAPLPEIPTGTAGAAAAPDGDDGRAAPRTPPSGAPGDGPSPLPSSRRTGALLLAGIAAVVIVAVVLITSSGGSRARTSAPSSASATNSSSSKAATAGKATEDKRITLTSPDPASKAIGVAEVLSEGSKYAFYLAAEHLLPSRGFFYAVWLYNSPTSHEAISRTPSVGADGRMQGGALLPANAGTFHTMLLTRETSNRPTRPGPVVLSGSFGLH